MEVGLLALLSLVLIVGVLLALRKRAAAASRRHRGTVLVVLTTVVGVATRLDFAVVVAAVCLAGAALAGRWRVRWSIRADGCDPARGDRARGTRLSKGLLGGLVARHLPAEGRGVHPCRSPVTGGGNRGQGIPLLVLVGFSVVHVLRSGSRASRHAAALAGAVVFSTAAYSIWVGGDAWEWSGMVNRYMSVGLPAAAIAALLAASTMITRPLAPKSVVLPHCRCSPSLDWPTGLAAILCQ